MMLEEHFLLITVKSRTGHLAKVLSPLSPLAAAPCSGAAGRGRQDAEHQAGEPPPGPDPAGSSTGRLASAARDSTDKPGLLVCV